MSIAALLLLPFALRHVRRVATDRFKYLILAGLVGTFFPAFLFAYAETRLASGLAGVLNGLTAVFTLVVGALLFGQRLTRLRVLGIGLGLAGTVVLMLLGGSGAGPATPAGAGNAWYGPLHRAGDGGLRAERQPHQNIPLQPLAPGRDKPAAVLIGPLALIYLFGFSGFTHKLATVPRRLAGPGLHCPARHHEHAVAMVLFNRLIQQSTTLFASSNTYLIPIVALGWGLLDGELINGWHVLGMVIILASVFIIHRAE